MGERCPHSPLETTGWLTGWRLTFGGEEHGWDGALPTIVQDPIEQVFVAVYDVSREDESALDALGGGRLRPLPQDQGPGLHADRRDGRVDLRARRLRGRAAVGVVPRRPRRRRRGRRRPRRLRRRASAAGPAARPGSSQVSRRAARSGRPPRRCCRRGRGRRRRSRRRGTPARAAARAAPRRRASVAASKNARTAAASCATNATWISRLGPDAGPSAGWAPIQKSGLSVP